MVMKCLQGEKGEDHPQEKPQPSRVPEGTQQPLCVPEGTQQPSSFQVAEQVPEAQVPWIPQGKQRPCHRGAEQRPWFREAEQIPEERVPAGGADPAGGAAPTILGGHQVTRVSPARQSLTPRNPCGSPRSGLSMSLLDGSPTPSPGHRAAQLLRGQTLAPQNIDRAMFITLVTLLEEVKDTLKLHGQMLNALLKKDSMPVMAIPDGAVFPLANVEDVIAMNEKLSDPEFMSAVVAMVADIGGSSLEDDTRRMMKFLMVPELQRQYNVTGRMGKLCFKDLRLFEVFYCALKSNAITQSVNRKQVEMALGKWFTGARDRGGEMGRKSPKTKGSIHHAMSVFCIKGVVHF
ncbi:uncharacterized protein si:dkey-172k15.5 [Micropterus dolomieu]|uniref:uncharacterized protein si:dkey-172k15.5 n=1 Tax=Micropterus dolomieu TaxID=147949 RepID=UPI001E8EF0A8|nr:uncharacterized protein si:dkey-172k15.5 [Micropterus dolomieu]